MTDGTSDLNLSEAEQKIIQDSVTSIRKVFRAKNRDIKSIIGPARAPAANFTAAYKGGGALQYRLLLLLLVPRRLRLTASTFYGKSTFICRATGGRRVGKRSSSGRPSLKSTKPWGDFFFKISATHKTVGQSPAGLVQVDGAEITNFALSEAP
jgi:hypothetical protein